MQLWGDVAGRVERASEVETSRLVIPVSNVASLALHDSFESPRSNGRRHLAIDILAPRNTPVLAAVDGMIRKLHTSANGGLTIYQFDRGENRVYSYAHLQRYRAGLREGTFVRAGEVIGFVGMTGNAETPHLHFAIAELSESKDWGRGTPLNPYPLLIGSASAGSDLTATLDR